MITGYEGFEVPRDKYHVISTPLVTNSGVEDIFIAEDRYALLATGSGVDVLDLFSGEVTASGIISDTVVLSVAADFTTTSGYMYVGTSTKGVYAARWKPLRHPGLNFTDQLFQLYSTTSIPAISSDQVNDLDANPFRLLISTGSGVDYIVHQAHTDIKSTRLLESGSGHCQLTNAGEGYWTVANSGVEASYNMDASSGTGVILADFEYNNTSSTPRLLTQHVNDISVREGNPNLLNFATPSGDFVIEEQQGAEATSQTKYVYTSEGVVSADFSPNATFDTQGTKYVVSTGSAIILGLIDDAISGTHYQEIDIGEKYIKENTRDQALVTGTITLIRTTSVA